MKNTDNRGEGVRERREEDNGKRQEDGDKKKQVAFFRIVKKKYCIFCLLFVELRISYTEAEFLDVIGTNS